MGANRTARTRPAKTEGHALRPGISNAIYLIAFSAYSACVSDTFYVSLQHTEISTCTMQVHPWPAEDGAPALHCGTPPAAPIRKRCQAAPPRPPGPGLCWRCAAQLQELASTVALARSDVQQVAQQPGARTIQREQRQALPLFHPALLATTLQVQPRRSPIAQGQLIDYFLHQPAKPGDFACQRCVVASPPWPASRTGLATAAPAVLAACPHAARRRAARLASESRARLPVPPPPPHLR